MVTGLLDGDEQTIGAVTRHNDRPGTPALDGIGIGQKVEPATGTGTMTC